MFKWLWVYLDSGATTCAECGRTSSERIRSAHFPLLHASASKVSRRERGQSASYCHAEPFAGVQVLAAVIASGCTVLLFASLSAGFLGVSKVNL